MEDFELFVALGLFLAGLVASIAIYLGRSDPKIAAGEFGIGVEADSGHERGQSHKDEKHHPPGKQ